MEAPLIDSSMSASNFQRITDAAGVCQQRYHYAGCRQ